MIFMNKTLRKFETVRTAVAISIALIVGFAIILLVSNQPIEALIQFIIGPLTKVRYLGNVVEAAIPLVFAGLAVSMLFQSGMFNMGSEGIFYFSGLLAAIAGITLNLPPYVHSLVSIIIGAVAGAIIMGIIGVVKAKWDASELVLSLMFNTILFGVGLYILNYYFREGSTVVLKSVPIKETALLSKILPGTRIHSGLVIAILAIVFCQVLLYKTKIGYEIRMVGSNPKFANYSGINVTKIIIVVSLIAGALAGVGGSIEILGMYDSFKWVALPGLGFDGALVAMLAKNKPKNIVVSSLFLAYIRTGADLMARLTDMPAEMVGIMQGLIILMISGQQFLKLYRERLILKEVEA